MVDLSIISSSDLRAELNRRAKVGQTKGKPMLYRKKSDWAKAKVAEYRAEKDKLKMESGTGGDRGRMRRHEQYKALDEQIEKFTRLEAMYRRKDE
jgi:hypothetical protein